MIRIKLLLSFGWYLLALSSAFVYVEKSGIRNHDRYNAIWAPAPLYASKNKEGRRLTPAQKAIQESVRKSSNNFDKFKQVAYGTADGIQSVSGRKEKPSSKSFVVGGYADLQNRATPTQQLIKALNDPKDVKSGPSSSVFESVKGAIYNTVDAASSVGKIASSSFRVTEPIEKEMVPTKYARDIVDSIPDLQSINPIKRIAAEAKLKNMEIEEKVRNAQKEAQSSFDSVKQNVYAAADFVTDVVENVKEFPGKVTKSVQDASDFLNSIPITVQTKVNDVKAIPSKVEAKVMEVKQSVEDVKKSVDNTVENTKQIIEDVKNIPNKVQETVENTKKTIDTTVKIVEEATTTTKVILGLEKPKPKPPKTPPPKPTTPADIAGDIAFKVAGSVVSTTGKIVLWAGKSAVQLTATAALKGFEAVRESITKQQQLPKLKPSQSVTIKPEERTDSMATPKLSTNAADSSREVTEATVEKPPELQKPASVLDNMDTDDFDAQIAEALKLAEEALSPKESTSRPVDFKDNESDKIS